MVTEAAIPSSGCQERLKKAEEKKRKLAVREVTKKEYESTRCALKMQVRWGIDLIIT